MGALIRRAAVALLLVAAAARAEDRDDGRGDVRAGLSLFVEPASAAPVIVVTPQIDARVRPLRWLEVQAGWDADVVSGATPRTYGRPDAVSGATRFSDARDTFGLHLAATAGPARIGAGYRYGFENDYRSHVVSVDGAIDLPGRNSTLAASWAHNVDRVCDLDNGALSLLQRQPLTTSRGCFAGRAGLVEEPLSVDGVQLSVVQVLSARLLAQAALSWEHLDGFQSNPYRRVRLLDAIEAQESHPSLRDRFALLLRLRDAVPRLRGAISVDARLYRDTWAVNSATLEVGWEQHLGERLLLRLRARGYLQSRALFYRDAGEADSYERAGPAGRYFTGDRELAPFADLLVGARLAYVARAAERRLLRVLDALEAALRIDLVSAFALTPRPPDAARFGNGVDALVLGGSLIGRF